MRIIPTIVLVAIAAMRDALPEFTKLVLEKA